MTPPLFVYGTLKRSVDGTRHRLLREARFADTASISGELYDLGAYPGVYRNGSSSHRVDGELYELPSLHSERVLEALDRYEGGEFIRKRIYVTLRGGRRRVAWSYLLRRRPDASPKPDASTRHLSK